MSDIILSNIRDIPDFPKPGIIFKDITPVLESPEAFAEVIDRLHTRYKEMAVDKICAIESRGFIFGSVLAYRLGCGMAIVRKPGKLPSKKIAQSYELEYGTDTIEMHVDSVKPGERVVVVDDLLATGGTAAACIELLKKVDAEIVECAFMVELGFLTGREKLAPTPCFSLITF